MRGKTNGHADPRKQERDAADSAFSAQFAVSIVEGVRKPIDDLRAEVKEDRKALELKIETNEREEKSWRAEHLRSYNRAHGFFSGLAASSGLMSLIGLGLATWGLNSIADMSKDAVRVQATLNAHEMQIAQIRAKTLAEIDKPLWVPDLISTLRSMKSAKSPQSRSSPAKNGVATKHEPRADASPRVGDSFFSRHSFHPGDIN